MAGRSGSMPDLTAVPTSISPFPRQRRSVSSEQMLVHLVDDDEAIRRSAGFMLKTSGFKVLAYESGVELLKNVRSLEPGAILLDIRMPQMDGLEVQRALQEQGC